MTEKGKSRSKKQGAALPKDIGDAVPSPAVDAMTAFFLAEREDANPDFEAAFLEAIKVSNIEQEIEVQQGLKKNARSSAERADSERVIEQLEVRRKLLLWPLEGSDQGAGKFAAVSAKVPWNAEPWIEIARDLAREIIKRGNAKDLYPSQEDIADEIAKKLRQDGVMGASGKPLSSASIKRHALKGISSAQGKRLSTVNSRSK